jgi:hypothetical protein
LKTDYGADKAWFVNVYAPLMGWDNHATRSFNLIDRLHKKNDMRFNMIISYANKNKDFNNANGAYTHQRMEYARNMCVFKNCGNALELKDFIQGNHGCLHGIHVVSVNADSHVRENLGLGGIAFTGFTPFSDKYNVYAWSTGSQCLDVPDTKLSGFLI